MAAIADSWEDMDDVSRVQEHLKNMDVSVDRKSPGPTDGPVSVIVRDDTNRTQYPNGPPQVRILKRSDPAPGTNGLIAQKRPQSASKPSKSYQERHAEYQEARLRILGKTEDPEPNEPPAVNPPPLHVSHSSPALSSERFVSASNHVNLNFRSPSMTAAPPLLVSPFSVEQTPFHVPPPPLILAQRPPPVTLHNYIHPQMKPELVIQRDVARMSVLRPGESWPMAVNPVRPVSLLRTPRGPDDSQGFRGPR